MTITDAPHGGAEANLQAHDTAAERLADAGQVVLDVQDLSVSFPSDEGPVKAVQNLTYQARLGRTLAIVGESGSGKSVSSLTVLGLHNPKRSTITGSVKLDGTEIVGAPESVMRKLRSEQVAMVFQDPLSALHPFYKVGKQIAEAYLAHHNSVWSTTPRSSSPTSPPRRSTSRCRPRFLT